MSGEWKHGSADRGPAVAPGPSAGESTPTNSPSSRPPLSASIMGSAVRPFLKVARELGADVDMGLANVGLSEAEVTGPEARPSHTQLNELLRRCVADTGARDIGLRAARVVEPAHMGLLDVALRTQPTLGDGLRTLEQLCPLLHDAAEFRVERETENTVVLTGILGHGLRMHPAAMDFVLGTLLRAVHYIADPSIKPLEVHFRGAAPVDTALHEEVFGCPLLFNAARDAMVLSASDLEQPLIWADRLSGEALVRSARNVITKITKPDRWEERVAQTVRAHLEQGRCDANAVAKELGMTLRTLQRKLVAEGTSVSAISDRERARVADNYLRDPNLSFDQIAERLGFASTPGFHRAIKRWTGETSAHHRQSLLGTAPGLRGLHVAPRSNDQDPSASAGRYAGFGQRTGSDGHAEPFAARCPESTKPTIRAIPAIRLPLQ